MQCQKKIFGSYTTSLSDLIQSDLKAANKGFFLEWSQAHHRCFSFSFTSFYCPPWPAACTLTTSQSRLTHIGQFCCFFRQFSMQWTWKAWLQTPKATRHCCCASCAPSPPTAAVHSMHRSARLFRQMAQTSTVPSKLHVATRFHFFTSQKSFPVNSVVLSVAILGSWTFTTLFFLFLKRERQPFFFF